MIAYLPVNAMSDPVPEPKPSDAGVFEMSRMFHAATPASIAPAPALRPMRGSGLATGALAGYRKAGEFVVEMSPVGVRPAVAALPAGVTPGDMVELPLWAHAAITSASAPSALA